MKMLIKFLFASLLYFKVFGYECGISYNQERAKPNIINKEKLEGDWPWVVAIFANGEKICTGSIISPRFVLTAAHCYNHQILNRQTKRHSFSIHAGTIYANEGEIVKVKKIRTFDEDALKVARNDIAIFELVRPLTFNHNVSNICLPKIFNEFPGNIVFVAGFGNTLSDRYRDSYHEEHNVLLNDVTIEFREFDYCDPVNNEWNYNSSNYICAGSKSKGISSGDSGGPLMIKEAVFQQGRFQSRWIAVGVVVGGNYIYGNDKEYFLPWSHCIEVGMHQLYTTKSTLTTTTIPPTKLTPSTVSKVKYSCYDTENIPSYKTCPTSEDDHRCSKKGGYWVRYSCPESCGLCKENGLPRPFPPNASCKDADSRLTYCLRYKDKGLCDDPQNPQYRWARNLCAYTCGVC